MIFSSSFDREGVKYYKWKTNMANKEQEGRIYRASNWWEKKSLQIGLGLTGAAIVFAVVGATALAATSIGLAEFEGLQVIGSEGIKQLTRRKGGADLYNKK